ncbi:MAG: isoleucine--tRNA ligase [Candidatus Anammoxibacter sp.]
MDYKNTLNLPKTKFPMKANLLEKEPLALKRWEKEDLYGQIRKARAGAKKMILHDGPPYPTEDIHIGTGLNKILKDIIIRFHTMRGYDAPYVPGWDCHGLPIEHRVMQELGDEALKLDKVKIRQKCKKYAEKFVKIQKEQFKRLGVMGDWENPYLTLDHEYEAGILEVFGKLVEKGYVYRSKKPIHWCMKCHTALAEAELDYKDKTSPSIYVNFPMTVDYEEFWKLMEGKPSDFKPVSDEKIHILIWTTTPWTLPANLAVALHTDFEYTAVRYKNPGSKKTEITLMVSSLVDQTMKALSIDSFDIIGNAKGKALEGLSYKHVLSDRICNLILADYVSISEGTGCVHTAPGHGQDDYISGLKYKLSILSPVDEKGEFTEEAGELKGLYVYDANKVIIEKLREKNFLMHATDLHHSYPHCWRCANPVIFRATEQWFISIDNNDLRRNALEEIKKMQWVPAWGEERIAGMIQNRPDWCISRQRSWGVPIPAFYCKACKEPLMNVETVKSVRDMFEKFGADSWFYKQASEFLPDGTKCAGCGSADFEKENDIFDVWFESGSSHNSVLKKRKELSFPADIYLEGSDQHRGWFQLSLLPSIAAWGKAPCKTVITHGFVVDEKGEKMSKSKGNFISVNDALKKSGADIIRLCTVSMDYRNEMKTSYAYIAKTSDSYRRIRNTFRYLMGNLSDFNPDKDFISYNELTEIDKWALHKIQQLINAVTSTIEAFEFHRIFYLVHNFCAVEMSSFYLDILKDRLYTFAKDSVERRSTQTVLQHTLLTLVKLIAPVMVFTSDEIWAEIEFKDEDVSSVHLATWPSPKTEWIDDELSKRWDKIIEMREDVSKELEKLRVAKLIGNSMEARIQIYCDNDELFNSIKNYENELAMIFIVSEVNLIEDKLEDSVQGQVIKELWIKADVSENKKCARCWNFRDSVGNVSDFSDLCKRCSDIVKN